MSLCVYVNVKSTCIYTYLYMYRYIFNIDRFIWLYINPITAWYFSVCHVVYFVHHGLILFSVVTTLLVGRVWWNFSETWPRDFVIQSGICKIVGEHVFGDPSPATNDRHTTALKARHLPSSKSERLVTENPTICQMHFIIWWNFTIFLFSDFVLLHFFTQDSHIFDGSPHRLETASRLVETPRKRCVHVLWRWWSESCQRGELKPWEEEILWMLPLVPPRKVVRICKNPAIRAFQEKDQMESWFVVHI